MDDFSAGSGQREQRVEFHTDSNVIRGTVTLPREGYRSRLSDFLNRSDMDFFPVTDAETTSVHGGEPVSHPFVALARTAVRLAVPLEAE